MEYLYEVLTASSMFHITGNPIKTSSSVGSVELCARDCSCCDYSQIYGPCIFVMVQGTLELIKCKYCSRMHRRAAFDAATTGGGAMLQPHRVLVIGCRNRAAGERLCNDCVAEETPAVMDVRVQWRKTRGQQQLCSRGDSSIMKRG